MGSARGEIAAVLTMMVIVGVATVVLSLFIDHPVPATGNAPANPCAAAARARAAGPPVVVSDSAAENGTLALFTDRTDDAVQRRSAQLSVTDGTLKPDECLGTSVSNLVRADGHAIPNSQVSSWAESDDTGTRVTIYVEVSPRYGTVTGAGGYTGSVYLDDVRAIGGNVAVAVHIAYPHLGRAALLCFIAAWAGFLWAWLVNQTKPTDSSLPRNRFWLLIVLQLAVLIAVPLSVLNAQVLTNPDWTGSLSQYIALHTVAGGGAAATTPTLKFLIDRVVLPSAGRSGSPAAAPGSPVPEVPAALASPLASTPAGGDGGSLTAPMGGDGGSLGTALGRDGGSLGTPPIPPFPREPLEP